jgi:hypothetical protein
VVTEESWFPVLKKLGIRRRKFYATRHSPVEVEDRVRRRYVRCRDPLRCPLGDPHGSAWTSGPSAKALPIASGPARISSGEGSTRNGLLASICNTI